ncbi:HAD-IA family hydrolase [Plasticicumulans acidivorans]|uniref:Phosphoglycolate phosphatase n=1 Tax=Plasticicumulans acidivorans TaxID=886464 RepID=A0A317MX18_9GAMM|nr:HAD-IA family hydrolase [Plasticicumulans acidivorans]PWV59509.1 phosphoglycolate phosphatase [Plasticicumulans acidivorans]
MSHRYELLVFDWDGTLMDSEFRIVACLRAASHDCGLPELSAAEYRHIIGLGLLEACAVLYPDADAATHAALAEAYKQQFLYRNPAQMQLFDGARATLEQLRAAGYRLAVATGKSRVGLDRALRDSGLGALFEATRCADETASKPDPRMLFELYAELDVAAERALMIGDTEFDLVMARAAGSGAIAATYGVHAREHLARFEPLAHLDDIAELPAVLATLTA